MTPNLPRREFLKKAGLMGGMFTLSGNLAFIPSSLAPASLYGYPSLLNKLTKQIQSIQTLNDTALLNIYNMTLSSWEKSGYEAFGTDYYICHRKNLVLFPLHLHHELVGLVDFAVLCFERNQAGEWVKLRPLSGFDLEALNAAVTSLQLRNPAVDLDNYLLPNLSLTHANPFCFNTPKGDVFIKTFMADNNSNTEIIVKERNRILFQEIIRTGTSLA